MDSKEELYHTIDQWAESKRLEQFFANAEGRVADLDADERLAMLDKLKSARELVGSSDALKRFQSWKSPEER
jgi:hypothetical protein